MIWGMTLHPGEEWTREIRIKEHLTLAALECRPWKYNGEPNPAACLLLKIDNNDHVICTLEKGSTPQQNLDLVLQQRETVTFTVEGTGIVYITGYSSGDNVNLCEETSMLVQTNPLVQQEVAGDSLSGYDDEQEVSSDTEYYSKEGNSNKIQEIKNEVVISSDFHEEDEERSEEEEEEEEEEDHQPGHVYDIDNLSPSLKTLNSPPKGTDIENETEITPREDISSLERQVSTAYESASLRLAEHCPTAGNISSNSSVKRIPESSVRRLVYGINDRTSMGVATETSSLQTLHKDEDYEALIEDTLEVKVLPRPDQNHHKKKKISCLGEQIIKSSPASISYPVFAKSFQNRRTLKKKEKLHSQHLKDGKYKRLISYCRGLPHHQGMLENYQTDFRPFKCQYCGKSFLRKACVRVHERIHTGEKPFKCKYCSKTFNQKAHVQSHEIVHTGDKNFKCQFCDKAFAHLSTAKRHERIHTRA